MSPGEVLTAIEEISGSLAFEDGALKYHGPKETLTDELRNEISANRNGLIWRLGYCHVCKLPLTVLDDRPTYRKLMCPTAGIDHVLTVQNLTNGGRMGLFVSPGSAPAAEDSPLVCEESTTDQNSQITPGGNYGNAA